MRVAIVTSADAKYFPLLSELLASIMRHRQARDLAAICIIDAGLTAEQNKTLMDKGYTVANGIWPVELSDKRIAGREFLKACVSRPFIPALFPGHDVYVWMDADTWVQDWSAIDLLVAGAQKSGMAVVPQVDRAYGKTMRISWFGPIPYRPRSFYYSNARKSLGGKMARKLFPFPTINAGVFAMAGKAPHWARWQELIKQVLEKPRANIFTAEQLTMGVMAYVDQYPTERLPSVCNWLCDTTPMFDPSRRAFVEPNLPHQPIGILHLTGLDAMRADKSIVTDVLFTDGATHPMSLRYADGG
jgi:hypothetical protein